MGRNWGDPWSQGGEVTRTALLGTFQGWDLEDVPSERSHNVGRGENSTPKLCLFPRPDLA